jgi:hypothetical protein
MSRRSRVGELGGIPVGGTGRDENPEQFLDGRREQRRVLPQPGHLLGLRQQRQGAGGDQVDGGVEARHDQMVGSGEQLGLAAISFVRGRSCAAQRQRTAHFQLFARDSTLPCAKKSDARRGAGLTYSKVPDSYPL